MTPDQEREQVWLRPALERSAPRRSAAHVYRVASGDPRTIGGVTLDNVEDAVVAAVRLGYKVADAQIERSSRLARRLRQAGSRAAGPKSEVQALDATEQVIFKAMMAGLSWFEGVSTDQGNPFRRLASAQYRILGAMLGLSDPSPVEGRTGRGSSRPRGDDDRRPSPQETPASTRRPRALRIRHGTDERRAVHLREFDIEPGALRGRRSYELSFYGPDRAAGTLAGSLTTGGDGPTLTVHIRPETPAGRWTAAICHRDGTQIGCVAIEL